MGITTRIDQAGRLVIPKSLRDHYGLGEGAEVEIAAIQTCAGVDATALGASSATSMWRSRRACDRALG